MVNKLYHRLYVNFPSKRQWKGSCGYFTGRICFDNCSICSYLQSCQISSESDLHSKSASKRPNKGSTPTKEVRLYCFICLSCFSSLFFSCDTFYNIVFDKHFWHFVSRSSIRVHILGFSEFIIKSSCLLLAVPRDSPNCKKDNKANISHEREHDIRKDLKL